MTRVAACAGLCLHAGLILITHAAGVTAVRGLLLRARYKNAPRHLGGQHRQGAISNGKYDGIVRVQVWVPEDRVPKPKYWNCSLHVMRANSGLYGQLSPNAPQDECMVKPGAALVTHVSGTLRVRVRLPHTGQPRAGGFVRGK